MANTHIHAQDMKKMSDDLRGCIDKLGVRPDGCMQLSCQIGRLKSFLDKKVIRENEGALLKDEEIERKAQEYRDNQEYLKAIRAQTINRHNVHIRSSAFGQGRRFSDSDLES